MERLPGFRDFYPEPLPHSDVWSADVRNYLFDKWRNTARAFGFREYDGPPLEPLDLYTLKSGEEIVGQLYNFIDKGNRAVALRPEMTPTLARLVGAHERHYKKPVKWFSIPQLFRYERQQKGRLREHFQFNADLLGETDPAADAELIALLISLLQACGLTPSDFVIRLSSRNAWHDYFARSSADPAREYEFYQVIDKLERATPDESEAKLAALGLSLDAVRHFIEAGQPTPELSTIIQDLSARGLAEFVKIDYNVIRGLAYYTGPVFEAFDRQGQFRAIAGGGRYDHLVGLITGGKVQLPAAGFGLGDVVLTEIITQRRLLPKLEARLDAFCLIEDESIRRDSLRLIHELRQAGCAVDFPLAPLKSDKQFKRALDSHAAYTLRLERSTHGEISVRIKNLRTREENVASPAEVLPLLRLP
ncbi:MAG: ATP phosphoribosyltransferase regulatory subunit [Candidatus Omnitrophica bacterium]|nr:ATP phosphoribosyltransferase regulatory subunit [Candidatus Omnitrophota bacterium]